MTEDENPVFSPAYACRGEGNQTETADTHAEESNENRPAVQRWFAFNQLLSDKTYALPCLQINGQKTSRAQVCETKTTLREGRERHPRVRDFGILFGHDAPEEFRIAGLRTLMSGKEFERTLNHRAAVTL